MLKSWSKNKKKTKSADSWTKKERKIYKGKIVVRAQKIKNQNKNKMVQVYPNWKSTKLMERMIIRNWSNKILGKISKKMFQTWFLCTLQIQSKKRSRNLSSRLDQDSRNNQWPGSIKKLFYGWMLASNMIDFWLIWVRATCLSLWLKLWRTWLW